MRRPVPCRPALRGAWSRGFAFACAVVVGTLARDSSAEPVCDGASPWVRVVFARGEWPSAFETAVLNDLDAGFEGRGVSACREGAKGGRPPAAVVTVTGQLGSDVSVAVEVSDTVTHKRVARDADLASVPSDGRAFALALAIDELVWATWAELAFDPKRQRHEPAPKELVEAVKREIPKPLALVRVGARGGLEYLPGELTELGGDAVFVAPLVPRLYAEVAAAVRLGLTRQAPHGELSARSLGLAGALRYELWSPGAVRVDLALGARAALIQFHAMPDAGAGARDFTDLAVDGRALGYARVPLAEPLELEIGAGFGWPLRTVVATDAGEAAGGVRGPELLASLGLLVNL